MIGGHIKRRRRHNLKAAVVSIEGRNIDEAWFCILSNLNKARKYRITKGSFEGSYRYEFDKLDGIINKPIEYNDAGIRLPLAVTVPNGCAPPTDEDSIYNYYKNYLLSGSITKNEHYKYGTFIVGGQLYIPDIDDNKNIKNIKYKIVNVPNQLEWAIEHYCQIKNGKKNFGNNHCYIQLGYPEMLLGYDIEENYSSPCLRGIDTKIIFDEKENKYYLCFHVYFRSWDLWSGFPTNMGGLALLMEYMVTAIGVEIGYLSFSSIKAHFYDFSINSVIQRCGLGQ